MKVIILGAGQVGFSIARYLVQERNHITIVDHSPAILDAISDKLDNSPDLPLEFFESGAVTTASFYDFEQKCRSSLGGKLDLKFSGLMDNFLCHLKP